MSAMSPIGNIAPSHSITSSAHNLFCIKAAEQVIVAAALFAFRSRRISFAIL